MAYRPGTSFHVFVMIAVLAVMAITATGALQWQKRADFRLLSIMNEYHLASAEWAARAGQRSTAIVWLTRVQRAAALQKLPPGSDDMLTIGTSMATFIEVVGEHFHQLTKHVRTLDALETEFGTAKSATVLAWFVTAVEDAEAALPVATSGQAKGAALAAFDERIQVLNFRAEQLFRYHMAQHDMVAMQAAKQQRRNRLVVGSVLAVIIGFGVAVLVVILRRIRRADSALRQSEQQYRGILDNMRDTYYHTDGDDRIVMASRSSAGLLGVPVDALLGRRLSEFCLEEDGIQRLRADLAAAGGEVENFQLALRRADGAAVWVSANARLLPAEHGNARGVEGVLRNVTEQRIAEAALRDSQARIAAMTEMAPEAIISLDSDLRIVLFNRGAEDIFGYAAEEMLGQPLDRLLPSEVRELHAQHIRTFAARRENSRVMGRRGSIAGVRKGGQEFPAEASIARLEVGDEIMFTVMLHDITDRKRAEQAAAHALQHAEAANAAKSKFLATMSHELRTPLNAVIGFAQILAKEILGPLGSDTYREYANDIEKSGQHLLAIINDILDLARIDAGHIELHESEVTVADLLESCRRMLAQQAQEKDLNFVLLPPTQPLVLWADQRLLRQTFLNLFSNAVKFTPAGGHVETRVSRGEDGEVLIIVEDNGIGMTAKEIKVAFEPFAQADDPLTRQYEGTGLGLSLSKSFVELHGGHIQIESTPDIGTSVVLSFPASRVAGSGRPPDLKVVN